MLSKILKYSLIFVLALCLSCDKDASLTTLSDFIGKDDSNPKLRREYKYWTLNESTITIEGKTPIIYKKGETIKDGYNPSRLAFLFKSDFTYEQTDVNGAITTGRWKIDETTKKLQISSGLFGDEFTIVTATRTNLNLQNTETLEGKPAVVTLSFTPIK